jgi:hypothetical protein
MQKPFLAILGAALLAGSPLSPVSANEHVKQHHHVGKAQRPIAAGQSFRNSNAAVWSEPSRYAPMIEPGSPNFYRDEAMSPPAGH